MLYKEYIKQWIFFLLINCTWCFQDNVSSKNTPRNFEDETLSSWWFEIEMDGISICILFLNTIKFVLYIFKHSLFILNHLCKESNPLLIMTSTFSTVKLHHNDWFFFTNTISDGMCTLNVYFLSFFFGHLEFVNEWLTHLCLDSCSMSPWLYSKLELVI